jgi:trehalose 6-phosphate synthase/phosphatase
VLRGLLGADLLGFQTYADLHEFRRALLQILGIESRMDQLDIGGRSVRLGVFPIGIVTDEWGRLLAEERVQRRVEELKDQYAAQALVIAVDRLDYTKGIPERFEALERLYQKHPERRGRFAFIQVAVPSRIELREYRDVQTRTRRWVQRINRRFPRPGGPTVHLIEGNLDFRELIPYYRMADLCTVTSLHDGMNLVAKEYLAASPDLDGALVLSPFTGAARELERAWIVSPYDREALADAYDAALSEPAEARRERMAALRETVLRRNIFDWTLEVLDAIVGMDLRTPARDGTSMPAADPELPSG